MNTKGLLDNIKKSLSKDFPLVICYGETDSFFVVYARSVSNFDSPINNILREGVLQHGYVSSEEQMKDACKVVGLPFMPASRYPAEMAYGKSSKGVIFCSPVPDDLPLDLWYADILNAHKAKYPSNPSFSVIAAVAAVISTSRFPQKSRRIVESKGLSMNAFMLQQYQGAVSCLEIDKSLDSFPY